jgi:hypothetical protein
MGLMWAIVFGAALVLGVRETVGGASGKQVANRH